MKIPSTFHSYQLPGNNLNLGFLADYTCALVGDLLLQGHLYITYNYFAFHSNVFGYVTKVGLVMINSCRCVIVMNSS